MVRQEPPSEQQKFFLHRDPILFLRRGEDMTLQQNYELHQKLTDEKHWSVGWDVTQLCDKPERRACRRRVLLAGARPGPARNRAYQGLLLSGLDRAAPPSGELRFVVYVNTGHSFLPGSATVDI